MSIGNMIGIQSLPSINGTVASKLYFDDGTAVNQSGGNVMVNVSNFAIGQFGSNITTANNLTSSLAFSEMFLFDGGNWQRAPGDSTQGIYVNPKSNVTLNPSSAHIGSVSIYGTITTGMTTLFPSPNYIGLVTNTPVKAWPDPGAYIGLVTANIVGSVNTGMLTLFPGPNSIGSVTLNNSNANIGSVSVLGGAVSMSNFIAPNTGNVTLNPSSAHIGSVSIFGTVTTTTGMTTLFGGPNQIGSVTVSNTVSISASTLFAVVNTSAPGVQNSMVTLNAGPNQIGSVTVSNWVSPNTGNVTLNPSPNQIGSVTVANTVPVTGTFWQATQPISASTLFAVVNTDGTTVTANQGGNWDIRSVLSVASINGNVNVVNSTLAVTQSGNWDIRSLLSIASVYANVGGTVAVSNFVAPNTGSVTLNNSASNIGSVSVLGGSIAVTNSPSIQSFGQFFPTPQSIASGGLGPILLDNQGRTVISGVSLYNSSANIGSVSVLGGAISVSNFIAPNVGNVTLNASNAYIGLVTIANTINANVSLSNSASNIGSVSILGGTLNTITSITNAVNANVSLSNSSSNIGSVSILGGVLSVSNFVAPNLGNVTLNASNANIGSVSVLGGAISVSNFVAPNVGNVTLNASNANIGSVSILGGLLNANVSLGASAQFIGNVTTYPGRSLQTSFATLYSGAGNYTLFTPPSGKRWYVHNLMINSQGVSDGNIKSGTAPKWPWAGLATYGGFAKTFTDSGWPANAVDDAFVVTLNSAATISVDTTVHFE